MYYKRNRPANYAQRTINNQNTHSHGHDHAMCGHDHDHSIKQEFLCHVPLAIFSLALSFVIVAVLKVIIGNQFESFGSLFHACHYAHLLFAATGATISFCRFSYSVSFLSMLAGMIIPFVFCTLSDVVLPTIGAQCIGIPIGMHLCILHTDELLTVSIFLLAGAVAGICLVKGSKNTMKQYAQSMHFFHIFVSAMAALFYMVMHGISDIVTIGGALFVILLISIVVPCIFSDCLVPYIVGKWYAGRSNRYQ